MKKIFLLSALALATGASLFAQNFLVMDSLVTSDSTAAGWQKRHKETLVWDVSTNSSTRTNQLWNGSGWVDYSQQIMTIDLHQNIIGWLMKLWTGTSWKDSVRYAYTYDANKNMTSILIQAGDNLLQNVTFDTFIFDANQKQASHVARFWDANASAWVDSLQNLYSYDSSGNQTGNIIQNWDGTAFVNDSQVVYTYDTAHHVLESINLKWYTNTWYPLHRDTFAYDANGKQISQISQYWIGTWANRWRHITTRSAAGDSVVIETNYWSGTQWTDGPKRIETYLNGVLQSTLDQQWNGTAHVDFNASIISYNSYLYPQSQLIKNWDANGTLTITRLDWYYSRNPACSATFLLYADSIPHHYVALNLATGTPDLTYVWSWGDGTSDTTAYPTHTYDTAGIYTICLTVTDSARCGAVHCDTFSLNKMMYSMISVTVIPPASVGVNNNRKEETAITIAPNPAFNRVQISLPQPVAFAEVSVINLVGERAATGIITGQKAELDVSKLTSGTYILQINTGGKIFRQKFMKGDF